MVGERPGHQHVSSPMSHSASPGCSEVPCRQRDVRNGLYGVVAGGPGPEACGMCLEGGLSRGESLPPSLPGLQGGPHTPGTAPDGMGRNRELHSTGI